MSKLKLLIFLIFIPGAVIYGKHNRAGEITYRQISDYTFEFTVTTFTYTLSGIDRPSLDVQWGDNTYSSVDRKSKEILPDYYQKNTYIASHTFPGTGVYEVVMQDPTRNLGVKNIPNSVQVVFSVKTTLLINPEIGRNSTPVLLNYPIDKAALGKKFIHNPAAFDPDGDSISYAIGICSREKGIPIENYTLPKASDSLYINPVNGDLVWDTPIDTGIFNIAINVEEWRKGIKIGNIVRDMQIEVYDTKNSPPVNGPLKDFCVEAGTIIKSAIVSTDKDNETIIQTASGGPFSLNDTSVHFTKIANSPGFAASIFEWKTNYNHVRNQPYFVIIKAQDDNSRVKLVDIDNFYIKVLAPSPKNVKALPSNNSISLKWSRSVCKNATGYEIYRSTDPSPFTIDSCNGGIPGGFGYNKIATLSKITDTTYLDDNSGTSLNLGTNYCYRIVATFADGAKSYPSSEVCVTLTGGVPSLTSANVTKIDSLNGTVFLSWIKPRGLDTIPATGPYLYKIYRTNNFAGENFKQIDSIQTADLSDTTYIDKDINTISFPYNYKVELFNNSPGNRFAIGKFETASTLYPGFIPADNQLTLQFYKKVPWFNSEYIIFRENNTTHTFDSIGYTNTGEYIDKGLTNNTTYTYKVLAYGSRELNKLHYKTLNWSHKNSGTPVDKTPPCPPVLNLLSYCDSSLNYLVWTNPNHSCSDDVVQYNIYYKQKADANFSLLATKKDVNDTTFRHFPHETLAGCYVVTAVDSFYNESASANIKCFNGCTGYSLPNVFTPNSDNINDIMVSYNPNHYVKTVDMKIFNRWGKLVFETNDPDINWDGKDKISKQYVPEGVYYYVCNVYEPHLGGIQIMPLTGFVYVYYTKIEKIIHE
jgi:gliding motility-associated-like protein